MAAASVIKNRAEHFQEIPDRLIFQQTETTTTRKMTTSRTRITIMRMKMKRKFTITAMEDVRKSFKITLFTMFRKISRKRGR